jgi:hypothetical protein
VWWARGSANAAINQRCLGTRVPRIAAATRVGASGPLPHRRVGTNTAQLPLNVNQFARVGSASMRGIVVFFSRRVPLYVSLPVIVACGVAGYVASTWQSRTLHAGAAPSRSSEQPRQARAAVTRAQEPPQVRQQPALSSRASSSREPPRIAVPVKEIDLPTPFVPGQKAGQAGATAPDATAPQDSVRPPPSAPLMKTAPQSPAATRPLRSASKPRPPQRTAQQRTGSAPASGLKSIPIIGPVFSLLQ